MANIKGLAGGTQRGVMTPIKPLPNPWNINIPGSGLASNNGTGGAIPLVIRQRPPRLRSPLPHLHRRLTSTRSP